MEVEVREVDLSELTRYIQDELKANLKSLKSELLSMSQNPALEKRVERLEAEIKAIRPAVEKMAKMAHSHKD